MKKIIWSDEKKLFKQRRDILKAAPVLIGGCFALPKMAAASFLRGSSTIQAGSYTPPHPAIASTWGYNTLSFWDDFNSLSTIDVNNTQASGFNWYTQQYDFQANSFAVQPASAFSVNGSILTFTPVTPNSDTQSGGAFSTDCYVTSPSKTFKGNNIIKPNGAYFECKMAFDATKSLGNAATQSWPAFWFWDKDVPLGYANSRGTISPRLTELDTFEAYPNGVGTIQPEFTDWDETGEPCSAVNCVRNTNYLLAGIPNLSDGNFHTYGTLWVPQSKNAGTGIIQRYVDGVHYASGDVSYSASTISAQANVNATTGWLSGLDTSVLGFTINLDTGGNWPIQVDYVQLWS